MLINGILTIPIRLQRCSIWKISKLLTDAFMVDDLISPVFSTTLKMKTCRTHLIFAT